MSNGGNTARETVTVNVYRDIYDKYKIKAEQERSGLKEYLNELLQNLIDKEEFVDLRLGHINIDSVQDNRVTLKDMKERRLIDVYMKNDELFCEHDNSTCCIHVRRVWASTKMGKLVRRQMNGSSSGEGNGIPHRAGSFKKINEMIAS